MNNHIGYQIFITNILLKMFLKITEVQLSNYDLSYLHIR